MHGFQQLNAALRRIGDAGDFGLDYEPKRRLRIIGGTVATTCEAVSRPAALDHVPPSVDARRRYAARQCLFRSGPW